MPEDKTSKYLKPEFPGNSNNRKDAEETSPDKEEKVVEGNVIQRKKSFGKRFAAMFTDGDAHNVGEYIIWDIAIPALKNMISDMVSNGAERMLFGEGGGRSRSRSNDRYRSNYTSYDSMYSGSRRDDRDDRREMSKSGRSRHNFKEIVLESRGEADDVLYRLRSRIDRYGQCSVSDLYDLVGISSNYMDDKWGWTDLRDSHIQRARGGFLLDLPEPEELDQ